MPFTKILFFSLCFITPLAQARIDLPRFAAKQAVENIRFVSHDGRFTYTQKRSGALSLSTSFKSNDVIESTPGSNYLISTSPARKKMLIEVERDWHQNLDLTKVNDIMVGGFNGTQFVNIGKGTASKLHLDDDWASWYDPKEKVLHFQFLKASERHHVIRLGKKHNPFFTPEVVMLNQETILYTDINDKGFSALLAWNMVEKKMTVLRKADQSGTRMELCRKGNYVALGEFSYEGTNRGSHIQVMAWKNNPSLSGFTTLYRVSDNDIGNLICGDGKLWFVKTMSEDRKLNLRISEAVSLDLATGKVTQASELERVTQLIEMDGRVLIPFREEIFVLDGDAGSKTDILKQPERNSQRKATP